MSDNAIAPGTAITKSATAAAMPTALSYSAPLGALQYTAPMAVLHYAMPPGAMHHAAAPRPIHYAAKRQAVQAAWVTRAMEAGTATARLIASGRAFESSLDLLRMQHAVAQQWHELGQDWVRGLTAWGQECTELKAANTMSKIVEQEFNLIGQFTRLLTDQTTALVNLMEGVQVGYGFWVHEKLDS